MDETDSDDIEVVSVHISSERIAEQPNELSKLLNGMSTEKKFLWSEISENGLVSLTSLRHALVKYDVVASEDQMRDMILIESPEGQLTIQQFISIVDMLESR